MRLVCRTLGLAPGTYYARNHAPSPKTIEDEKLSTQITQVFHEHKGRYGVRRIHAELFERQRLAISISAVRRLMARQGLIAIQPRAARPRTSDGKALSPRPNLLLLRGYPTAPNHAWAGDITYLPLAGGGWIYLAIVIDLYSRQIIGWQLATHLRAQLVCEPLQHAISQRDTPSGLYFHSDRGSQYGSAQFGDLLARHGLDQSMSGKGNPYHNSRVESAFGHIKAELLLEQQPFANLDHARQHLQDYLQVYYNCKRRHSSLGYQPPATFEALFSSTNNNPQPFP